jgi:hypothetical protein
MTTLDRKLAEIAGRAEKSAPAPWDAHDPGMYCGYACTPDGCHENHDSPVRQLEGPHEDWPEPGGGPVDDGAKQCFTADDADFIAHARTDVPALLRLVAVLREQRNSWIADLSTSDRAEKESIKIADAAALAALEGE